MSGEPGSSCPDVPARAGGHGPGERAGSYDAIWEWDLPSGALEWERGLMETFGYDADVAADLEWWCERVHPDDRERVEENLADRLASGHSWETRCLFRRADGEHVEVGLRGVIVRDDGEPERLIGTVVDLDRRRSVRRAYRELDERYRTLVEQNFVGIGLIQGGEFIYVNPQLAAIHGFEREELVGTTPIELVPEEARDEVLSDFSRLVEGEIDEMAFSDPVRRKTGGPAYMEGYMTRVDYHGDQAVLAVTVDVSDRIHAERALANEREHLDFLNAMLRHHVLNGMNIVLATADHLAADAGGECLDRLETIQDRGQAIVDLVQTIRSLVRTIRTSEARGFEPVDLGGTLERSVEAAATDHEDAAVALEGAGADAGPYVPADAMLSEAFDALLDNAIVHNDSAEPEVEVRVEADGDSVSVHVADDGPGIPRSVREDLFAEGTGSGVGGSSGGGGFGLNVVRLLVDLYGGSMRIRDRESEGTVVTVTLPRAYPGGE